MTDSSELGLRDDIFLNVVYEDKTRFGSILNQRIDTFVQDHSAVHMQSLFVQHGADYFKINSESIIRSIMTPNRLGVLYAKPGEIREEVRYPDHKLVNPIGIGIQGLSHSSIGQNFIPIPLSGLSELAKWIGEWEHSARKPNTPSGIALWNELSRIGCFSSRRMPSQPLEDGLHVLGHATVALRHKNHCLVFDPFMLPTEGLSSGKRPFFARDLAATHVFITHSHPDHYDLGSLLRLGADTKIFVPHVPRESILAISMADRLRELGFTQVTELHWNSEIALDGIRIRIFPLWGEQPTDRDIYHPEIRNFGACFHVESRFANFILLADAGQDRGGSAKELGVLLRQMNIRTDVVFGGYRAWKLHPAQYIFTSVARYLLFVPEQLWGQEFKIMNDADDLLDFALDSGAKMVVPYANGGAIWYSQIGLGPSHAGERVDDPNFDPPPRIVVEAYKKRNIHSFRLEILEPGSKIPNQSF